MEAEKKSGKSECVSGEGGETQSYAHTHTHTHTHTHSLTHSLVHSFIHLHSHSRLPHKMPTILSHSLHYFTHMLTHMLTEMLTHSTIVHNSVRGDIAAAPTKVTGVHDNEEAAGELNLIDIDSFVLICVCVK